MVFYTTGYLGDKTPRGQSKPAMLKGVVEALDGVLVDIRYSPRSRAACREKAALQALFGDRYLWVRTLGNANYKGGEIEIVDLAAGLATVEALPKAPILICACEYPRYCHRTVVGNALRERGHVQYEIARWDGGEPLGYMVYRASSEAEKTDKCEREGSESK